MFKLISLSNKEDITGFETLEDAMTYLNEYGYTKEDYTIEEYDGWMPNPDADYDRHREDNLWHLDKD